MLDDLLMKKGNIPKTPRNSYYVSQKVNGPMMSENSEASSTDMHTMELIQAENDTLYKKREESMIKLENLAKMLEEVKFTNAQSKEMISTLQAQKEENDATIAKLIEENNSLRSKIDE